MNREDFKKLDQLVRMCRYPEMRDQTLATHPELWWKIDELSLDSQMRARGPICWSRYDLPPREHMVESLDWAMRATTAALRNLPIEIIRDTMVKQAKRNVAKAREVRLKEEARRAADLKAEMNDIAWAMYGHDESDYVQ